MRKSLFSMLLLLAVASVAAAAPSLFTKPSESHWNVTAAGKQVATITAMTDGSHVRAEWKSGSKPAVTFLADKKVWVRATGGDIELAAYKSGAGEQLVVPALLLPITTSSSDKVEVKSGKVSSYSFGASKATYTYGKDGLAGISVVAGGRTYTLTRMSLGKPSSADNSLYAVRPKKTAATSMARLAGDLFGSSDKNVSATAGGRGVGKQGMRLNDGGDWDTLLKIESRDDDWKQKLASALSEFQREGHVGHEGGH